MADFSFARALDILAGTPPVLNAIVTNLPRSAQAERPAQGAWSAPEVLAHLLHAETQTMGPRVRAAALDDKPNFTPASDAPAPPGDPRTMSNAWADARATNLDWLRRLTVEERQRIVNHPRFGEVTIETYVAEWAYHDLDHLRQILAVLASDLYPHIGVFQSLYAPPA